MLTNARCLLQMLTNTPLYMPTHNMKLNNVIVCVCVQVYSVPIGGMCVRQQVSIGGSGSSYIYGFMDANYKPGMTKEQCMELVTNGK